MTSSYPSNIAAWDPHELNAAAEKAVEHALPSPGHCVLATPYSSTLGDEVPFGATIERDHRPAEGIQRT